MKKLLTLAAAAGMLMSAASFSMPLRAAEVPAHCAIFPLLKAECREAISAAVKDARMSVTSATVTVASASTGVGAAISEAVPDSIDNGWSCHRTPGGKALFACSK